MKNKVIMFCIGFKLGLFEPEFVNVGPLEMEKSKFLTNDTQRKSFIKLR